MLHTLSVYQNHSGFPWRGREGEKGRGRLQEKGYCYLFSNSILVVCNGEDKNIIYIYFNVFFVFFDDSAEAGVDCVTHQPPFTLKVL